MTGITGSAGGLHAQFSAEHHDGDFDEQFGTAGVTQHVGQSGGDVADQDARDQGNDEARFRGQADGPGNAEFGLLVGRGRDVGVGAQHEEEFSDKKDDGKGHHKAAHIAAQAFDAHGEHSGHGRPGQQQRADAGDAGIALVGHREGIAHARPHVGLEHPAQHVDAPQVQGGQDEDEAADKEGYAVFG